MSLKTKQPDEIIVKKLSSLILLAIDYVDGPLFVLLKPGLILRTNGRLLTRCYSYPYKYEMLGKTTLFH